MLVEEGAPAGDQPWAFRACFRKPEIDRLGVNYAVTEIGTSVLLVGVSVCFAIHHHPGLLLLPACLSLAEYAVPYCNSCLAGLACPNGEPRACENLGEWCVWRLVIAGVRACRRASSRRGLAFRGFEPAGPRHFFSFTGEHTPPSPAQQQWLQQTAGWRRAAMTLTLNADA